MPSLSPLQHFATLPDPRVERTREHPLPELLFIALCAVISGADSFVEIEEWGLARHEWLQQRLELPSGIPSHDTFSRVFAKLDPEAFGQCFLTWVAARRPSAEASASRPLIATDGKTVRRSFDRVNGQSPIHMVSAWAVGERLVLGQVKVAEKSKEITALPELLGMLDLEGAIVTADALNCQKAIATRIVDGGGDYVLALKGNQGRLYADVQPYLDDVAAGTLPDQKCRECKQFDAEHGRREHRRYWYTGTVDWLKERHGVDTWTGLTGIGMVESRRRATPTAPETVERRYYISSLPAGETADAQEFARAVRGHWGIENTLHWTLDLAFREDECRVRKDHAPQNLATLRHLTLNLLRQEKKAKVGVKARRMKAAWDLAYLEKVLTI